MTRSRELALAACALSLVGLAALPADAASKPKKFSGGYQRQLPPDPTGEAALSTFGPGCTNANAMSSDRFPLTLPGKGTLTVRLLALDPTDGKTLVDWDLYVLNAAGDDVLTESVSPGSDELTTTKVSKATKVLIEICNYTGSPNATVTYSYRPA